MQYRNTDKSTLNSTVLGGAPGRNSREAKGKAGEGQSRAKSKRASPQEKSCTVFRDGFGGFGSNGLYAVGIGRWRPREAD